MARASVALLMSAFAVAGGGIYPEGHFDFSTKLTVGSFDDHVKAEVDAGRTLFVRWIASEG
jgi:hypothetical protein